MVLTGVFLVELVRYISPDSLGDNKVMTVFNAVIISSLVVFPWEFGVALTHVRLGPRHARLVGVRILVVWAVVVDYRLYARRHNGYRTCNSALWQVPRFSF